MILFIQLGDFALIVLREEIKIRKRVAVQVSSCWGFWSYSVMESERLLS